MRENNCNIRKILRDVRIEQEGIQCNAYTSLKWKISFDILVVIPKIKLLKNTPCRTYMILICQLFIDQQSDIL